MMKYDNTLHKLPKGIFIFLNSIVNLDLNTTMNAFMKNEGDTQSVIGFGSRSNSRISDNSSHLSNINVIFINLIDIVKV